MEAFLQLAFIFGFPMSHTSIFSSREYLFVNESDPRSTVHYLGSSENKAWKNSGLYGIWTHDLCDTGEVCSK